MFASRDGLITVVSPRKGRPSVGEVFAPRARIVNNERWLSVYIGNERIAKFGKDDPEAQNKAEAARDRILSDFQAQVTEHNEKVRIAKAADLAAQMAEQARANAALATEYGALAADIAAHLHAPMPTVARMDTAIIPEPVVQEAAEHTSPAATAEEAPVSVVQEAAPIVQDTATDTEEEVPEPLTATQVERPAARAVRAVIRRPVRKPPTTKAKASTKRAKAAK